MQVCLYLLRRCRTKARDHALTRDSINLGNLAEKSRMGLSGHCDDCRRADVVGFLSEPVSRSDFAFLHGPPVFIRIKHVYRYEPAPPRGGFPVPAVYVTGLIILIGSRSYRFRCRLGSLGSRRMDCVQWLRS